MVQSRFNLGSTLKTLNLSLLRFNKRFGSKNLGLRDNNFYGPWRKNFGNSVILLPKLLNLSVSLYSFFFYFSDTNSKLPKLISYFVSFSLFFLCILAPLTPNFTSLLI